MFEKTKINKKEVENGPFKKQSITTTSSTLRNENRTKVHRKPISPVNDVKHFLQDLVNDDEVFVLKLRVHQLWYEQWQDLKYQNQTSGQSYKAPTIVIYDSRVIPDLKLPHIMTLES